MAEHKKNCLVRANFFFYAPIGAKFLYVQKRMV